jgi:hypothetical protein
MMTLEDLSIQVGMTIPGTLAALKGVKGHQRVAGGTVPGSLLVDAPTAAEVLKWAEEHRKMEGTPLLKFLRFGPRRVTDVVAFATRQGMGKKSRVKALQKLQVSRWSAAGIWPPNWYLEVPRA